LETLENTSVLIGVQGKASGATSRKTQLRVPNVDEGKTWLSEKYFESNQINLIL
jgi:hypothetical protein